MCTSKLSPLRVITLWNYHKTKEFSGLRFMEWKPNNFQVPFCKREKFRVLFRKAEQFQFYLLHKLKMFNSRSFQYVNRNPEFRWKL